MSMTPIHRIPQMDSDMPLSAVLALELNSRSRISAHEQIESMISHSSDENHLSITMDWAMQIRSEFGISWSESIDLAMLLYFG